MNTSSRFLTMINPRLLCLSFFLLASSSVRAALIPYYRMDSLALLADTVVLCEEQAVMSPPARHGKESEGATWVRCKVVQTFRGVLTPGAEFEIEYDALFSRVLPGDEGYTLMDRKGKVVHVVEPKSLPAGRALLFLQRGKGPLSYTVVTAKLIQGNKVYQFGQFRSNPGGLVLAPQGPENIQLAPTQDYGLAELLQDLQLALRNPASLKEPVPSPIPLGPSAPPPHP